MSNLPKDNEIVGVLFKALKSHPDDRGFFREIIRISDPLFEAGRFGQWSHSKMAKDVVKAWHFHHIQYDWWYVAVGQTETVLYDNRPESPTYRKKVVFKMGDAKFGSDTHEVCVRIPPGVLHGLKVLSEEAHLFYITSEVYNPNEEGRIPFDSKEVPHMWGEGVTTSERDRKPFTPTASRTPIA